MKLPYLCLSCDPAQNWKRQLECSWRRKLLILLGDVQAHFSKFCIQWRDLTFQNCSVNFRGKYKMSHERNLSLLKKRNQKTSKTSLIQLNILISQMTNYQKFILKESVLFFTKKLVHFLKTVLIRNHKNKLKSDLPISVLTPHQKLLSDLFPFYSFESNESERHQVAEAFEEFPSEFSFHRKIAPSVPSFSTPSFFSPPCSFCTAKVNFSKIILFGDYKNYVTGIT